jgi:hypothetical protein
MTGKMTDPLGNMARTRLLNSAVLRCAPVNLKPLVDAFDREFTVRDIRLAVTEYQFLEKRIAELFVKQLEVLEKLAEHSKTMTVRSREKINGKA